MWYARSHNGNLVHAKDAGRGWYSCDHCGRPVILRSGAVYRPYFAHRAYLASPECEEFHSGTRGNPGSPLFAPRPQCEVAPLALVSLYLSSTTTGFELNLLLPVHQSDRPWGGSVIYRDGRGVQRFACPLLRNRTRVHVLPQRDPYRFTKEGVVAESLWERLSSDVDGLVDRNVFYVSEVGGKRLEINAPMEFGQRYWLLTPTSAVLDEEVLDLCTRIGRVEGWSVYEVRLPNADIAECWARSFREHLEDWFLHPFKSPNPSVSIQSPFPLYSEADTWVFPRAEHFSIVVRGDPRAEPSLEQFTMGEEVALVRDRDSWVARALDAGLYTLRLEGRSAVSFRVLGEDAPMYTPRSMDVVIEGEKFPLFSCSEHIATRRGKAAPNSVALNLPEGIPVDFVLVNGKPWDGNDLTEAFADEVQGFHIEAGSFGFVRLDGIARSSVGTDLDPLTYKIAAWLLTIPPPSNSENSVGFPMAPGELPPPLNLLLRRAWPEGFAPHLVNLWHRIRHETSK